MIFLSSLLKILLSYSVLSECDLGLHRKPTTAVDGVDWVNWIDRVDRIDGIDRVDRVDGVDWIDWIDGVDWIDRVDGVDGVDRVDGVDWIDGVDRVNWVDRVCWAFFAVCKMDIAAANTHTISIVERERTAIKIAHFRIVEVSMVAGVYKAPYRPDLDVAIDHRSGIAGAVSVSITADA